MPMRSTYSSVRVDIDRAARRATITMLGPSSPPPASVEAMQQQGAAFWPLRLARELDDAILHLRLNEPDIGVLIFKSQGEPAQVLAYDAFLDANKQPLAGARDPALLEARAEARGRDLALAGGAGGARQLLCRHARRDRVRLRPLVHAGRRAARRQPAAGDARAVDAQLRRLPDEQRSHAAGHALPRRAGERRQAKAETGKPLEAEACEEPRARHVRFDHIDWDDEVRIFLEERSSFSADGLTGMEANLRFAGPETMETKIFGRLTAWQNWIFQRPNAAGAEGALKRYGTGVKANFNPERV